MGRLLIPLTCALAWAVPVAAQVPEDDPVDFLLQRLERAVNAQDRAAVGLLFATVVPEGDVEEFTNGVFVAGTVRAVVRERDRAQLEGAPPGDGYRLVVEMFIETAGRARILTTNLDIQRPPGGVIESWRIVGAEELTSVEGLFKLRLNTGEPLAARDFEITAEDLVLALPEGTVFLVECDEGVTGLVLLGRGEMRFSPAPASERGQLRIYAGTSTLVTPFESAFVRMSPSDYRRRVITTGLTPAAPDARLARRAEEVFRRESVKSFNVDLRDLTSDTWHLLPPSEDFLAEIDTQRFDTLTYARSSAQAEDVTLFHREDRRTIALYASVAKLAARGRFYSDDLLREYDVLDYNIDAAIDPVRQTIRARVRMTVRVRSTSLSMLMLRLADPLAVTGVTSVEYGRLLYFRVRGQNTVFVSLPRTAPQDSDVTLVVTYAGAIPSQELDLDSVQIPPDAALARDPEIETIYLLSNRSYWYPQNPISDYTTAIMRFTVPDGFGCVASGEPMVEDGTGSLAGLLATSTGSTFAFRSAQPVRYLAVVVSRLTRVAERVVPVADGGVPETGVDRIAVAVETTPLQQRRGRELVGPTEAILKFYTSLVNDAPYPSATIAVVESDLPGGHSPAYFALLNEPERREELTWRGDPASFEGFPDFFLAHELAHQWWGQAVGWKNYHEQWISEGFAQYFAALYARETRGEGVFRDMLQQFRRWSLSQSEKGPVHLGSRLGHLEADLRVFRALVYNKGAAVLHMLRLLLGDDAFFSGLRRFYQDRKYRKAGTDDLERAMELESGLILDRFFERWIYDSEMPRIRYETTQRPDGVVVRFEQEGELVFDLPVTVTIEYRDGRSDEVIVPITDRTVVQTIPIDGAVRRVRVNEDSAALAEFDEI